MRITRFRSSQLDRIMEIESLVFPEDAYDREMFLGLHRNWGDLFFVAAWHGEIAGYASSCLARGGAELVSIAVVPRARRFGIGRALMRRTLRAVAGAGAPWVSLSVREGNAAAIAFYRTFGFKRIRRVAGYYYSGEAAIRMRLPLRP